LRDFLKGKYKKNIQITDKTLKKISIWGKLSNRFSNIVERFEKILNCKPNSDGIVVLSTYTYNLRKDIARFHT